MEIVDHLYGLPLTEFTRARDQAARELRKTGDREAAERVKALRKPTVAAAAVNRLVREHRGEVERFLRAAAELRDAQFSSTADLVAAREKEREALARLARIGGEAVRQSLLAAAVDDDAARQLLEARLARELEPRGFGTLLAYAPPAAPRSKEATTGKRAKPASSPTAREKPAPPQTRKPDDTAARARLREAKAALRVAEAEEHKARRHWDQTRRELERAQAAVERAERDLAALTR